MIQRKQVAIIGAGVSGLAAAKAFSEKGHTVIGFERSHDLGGVWEPSRSYPDVQTQSSKDLYCYTDHPMPADYPEWPKGPQVHRYLYSYATKHDLNKLFKFNAFVKSMTPRIDDLQGWTLIIESESGEQSYDFDFVAVCTGQFSNKKTIEHKGQQSFIAQGGQIIHSSEYNDSATIKGKQVFIVGGAKSATDIAVNAANHGARKVCLIYQKNVWRVPYFIAGINFKHLIYMRTQEQQYNAWNQTRLHKIVTTLLKPFIWANFRAVETLLKLQLGMKKWNMIPDEPIDKAVSCAIPIVTPGLFESFNSGDIKPIQGTIDHYHHGQVVLDNGESHACDVVIQAIGWNLGLPFLADESLNRLIDDDGQYRVYRFSVNPNLPNMGFVGFNSSFCSVLSAEMIANWLVRFADRQLVIQPSRADMEANIQTMLYWRRKERPAAKVYGGLCSAPFHFKHFDELLADMGATKTKRKNILAEQFSYPKAYAYGEYLRTTPVYKVE